MAPFDVHCARAMAPPFVHYDRAMALLSVHYERAVASNLVLFAGAVTTVDVKTKKMVKQRELTGKMLASNHKIKRKIKYKNQ